MSQQGCPVSERDRRKTHRAGDRPGPALEVVDGIWQVRDLAVARQVLRHRESLQGGFNAEQLAVSGIRPPILYADGTAHRKQRAAIARYFAPRTVDTNYQELMDRYATQLVDEFRRERRTDLAQLSLRYSVMVAAQVVGLTNSPLDPMAHRLERFFQIPALQETAESGGRRSLVEKARLRILSVRGQLPLLAFHLHDVRPAIKARKAERQDDVISHLLDEDYSQLEILIECVTYAAAGMVTTREYIGMAVWHLLEDDELRQRYLSADKPGRYRVLHEILRLEPIVGHLLRRTTTPIEVELDGQAHTIPSGALVDIHIRSVNAQRSVVGDAPLDLCPGRELPPKVGDEVMSFGDGPHKCPGNSLAIQEADVLLQKLLALPVRLASRPRIGWDEMIKGYEVRSIELELIDAR